MYLHSKFKVPTVPGNIQNSLSTVPDEHVSSRNDLGPFAKMVLDSTDIAFRCKALLTHGGGKL